MDGDGPRRVQRVYSGVLQLDRAGKIGGSEVAAAGRWIADCERSMRSSYVDPATAGIRSGSGTNAGPELRLIRGVDASTRYRQACQAVGMLGDALLRACVADGKSLRALERETGCDRRALSNQLAETLKTLAEHYCDADRWGRDGILHPRPVRMSSEQSQAA